MRIILLSLIAGENEVVQIHDFPETLTINDSQNMFHSHELPLQCHLHVPVVHSIFAKLVSRSFLAKYSLEIHCSTIFSLEILP